MGKLERKVERVPLIDRRSRERRKIARSHTAPALKKEGWSASDIDLYEQLGALEAVDDFYSYRQFMNPKLKVGWFVADLCLQLQEFYDDWVAKKSPTMVLMAPPQHGKSDAIVDFLTWVAGKHPEAKQMLASYSDDLGVRANGKFQRMLDDPRYKMVFPDTYLTPIGGHSPFMHKAARNSKLLEFVGCEGSFHNITVEGQTTGKGLDFGVIDDPLKGRKEANSPTIRENVWNWLLDDFFTRFSEDAAMLMILTRWHVDDPAGRFIQAFPQTRVVKYEAIATKNERFRKKGEALFPEHKSIKFLLKRKKAMAQSSWLSLYQQSPVAAMGTMFLKTRFVIEQHPPAPIDIRRTIRYWDKAGTVGGRGAETAGVLMHLLNDGRTYIEDVQHGRWDVFEREKNIKLYADLDSAKYPDLEIWTEQEPGSGGKESAQRTILMLRGFKVFADRVTGDKVLRAEPYSAQVAGGTCSIKRAPWNTEFLEQHDLFPNVPLKDMVDASGGAFAKLTNRDDADYDDSLNWVG